MDKWLDTEQAAEFLKCSKSTVSRLCRSRVLSSTKRGIGLRINVDDLEAWLNKGKREATNFLLTSCSPININTDGRQQLLTKVRSLAFVKNGEYLSGTVYQRKTKRGWRWYINFSFRGRRVRKVALLAQTEEEALVVLQEEMRKAFDHEYGIETKKKKIIFKDFASEIYLETYAKVRKKSWKSDEKYLKAQLIPFFGEMELAEITPLTVDQYIAKRQKDGVKNSTINRELTVLKKMLNLAIDWQFDIQENPVKRARYFSEEKYKRDRVLSTEEEISLFRESAPHLKSILTCALQTGMRVGEILSLKWENVNLEKREITIKAESSKSGKARIIPITSSLLYELERLQGGFDKSNPHSDQFVFLYKSRPVKSIQVAFSSARLRAGIKDLTFHDLRHTFASRLASKGANPVSVKNILGHANLKTTEIYLHSNLNQMREAIELLDDSPVLGNVPSLICHRSKKGKKTKTAILPFSMN